MHVWPPTEFAHLLKPLPLILTDGERQTTLNLILPATIILVTSSFTCQFGVWAIRRGDHAAFRRNIAVTLGLGITFLLMQAYDYTVLFSEGLSMGSTPFGTTYFTLTGFHGAHVFGGALMLARGRVPRDGRPVLREAPRHGRGDVAVLALRRRRLDPPVLDPVPAVGGRRTP